eukprot:m.65292 g.65292  ORF g.65292 m.65292 type:complete len:58 (+) comp16480_c0_seq1:1814-1987(+)
MPSHQASPAALLFPKHTLKTQRTQHGEMPYGLGSSCSCLHKMASMTSSAPAPMDSSL